MLGISAAVLAAGCGSVPSSGEAEARPDAGSNAQMLVAGCSVVHGDIPAPNNSSNATRLGSPVIATATSGKPLTGSIRMVDAQSDAATLLVQVRGAAYHLVCAISSAERTANQIDLSRITVTAGSISRTQVVYFAVQDAVGNLGGYATATVSFDTPAPIPICGASSGPLQVLGQQVSAPTAQYSNFNGTLTDYVASPKQTVSVMAQGRIYLDMGTCTHLLLGSDPTGANPVGWDDTLLVEYRSAPGAAVGKAWFYGWPGAAGVLDARTSQALTRGPDATVAGTKLAPPVPDARPFGYPGRSIDLMTEIPAGSRVFELTLSALDYANVGSTTDVWLFAQ